MPVAFSNVLEELIMLQQQNHENHIFSKTAKFYTAEPHMKATEIKPPFFYTFFELYSTCQLGKEATSSKDQLSFDQMLVL